MRELKAYSPYANRDRDVLLYHNGDTDLILDDEDKVYLKEDVDALLAEKDKMLARHKYKRCLAMAKACKEKGERMYCEASTAKSLNEILGKEPNDAVVEKFELWGAIACTHCKRWLELAEKFKEGK